MAVIGTCMSFFNLFFSPKPIEESLKGNVSSGLKISSKVFVCLFLSFACLCFDGHSIFFSFLRWLITVSSDFQEVDFDGSLLSLFIT